MDIEVVKEHLEEKYLENGCLTLDQQTCAVLVGQIEGLQDLIKDMDLGKELGSRLNEALGR